MSDEEIEAQLEELTKKTDLIVGQRDKAIELAEEMRRKLAISEAQMEKVERLYGILSDKYQHLHKAHQDLLDQEFPTKLTE